MEAKYSDIAKLSSIFCTACHTGISTGSWGPPPKLCTRASKNLATPLIKKMIFFTNLSQVSVIFIYYCLLFLYFLDFELKQRKQILTPNNESTTKISRIEALRNSLFFYQNFWRVPEKIGKIEGVTFFSTVKK